MLKTSDTVEGNARKPPQKLQVQKKLVLKIFEALGFGHARAAFVQTWIFSNLVDISDFIAYYDSMK